MLFVIVCGWSMFGVGRWSLFFCCLLLFADPDDHLSLVVVCHCLSLVIVCHLSLSVVCRLWLFIRARSILNNICKRQVDHNDHWLWWKVWVRKGWISIFWTKIAVFSGFFLSGIVGYSPHPPRNEKSLCPRKLLQFKTSIFESLSSFDLSCINLWLIDLHREFQRFCFTIIYRCRGTETINPFAFFRLQEKIGWHSTLSHVYQG